VTVVTRAAQGSGDRVRRDPEVFTSLLIDGLAWG
jgi:hypothetical protein